MPDDNEHDAEPIEYASPPCFMHELQPGFEAQALHRDNMTWTDVARWRKAERKRLIDERLLIDVDVAKSQVGTDCLGARPGDRQGRQPDCQFLLAVPR